MKIHCSPTRASPAEYHEFSAAPITESKPRSPVVGFALLNGFFQFLPHLGDLEEGGIGRGRSLRHWMYINVYTRYKYIIYTLHNIYICLYTYSIYLCVPLYVHICICISCNILQYTLSRVTQLFGSTGYNMLQHPKCRWESYLRNLPGKCYFCWEEVKDTKTLASQAKSVVRTSKLKWYANAVEFKSAHTACFRVEWSDNGSHDA